MSQRLTVGSLFSGVGGFDLGFEREGFVTAWRCEIEPFCRDVLTVKLPGPTVFGDVRGVSRTVTERVDVLVGGFPCQDLSVAGQRRGLAGARSGLFFEFMRLVGELRPAWVVIENVPGLLSSHNGRDFALVLSALAERRYGWAYRVLDSRYFGVAQRRRRVFIVGCAGVKYDRAGAVLFESESGEGNFASSDEAGTDVAYSLTARAGGVGGGRQGLGNAWNTSYVPTAFNWQTGQEQEQFSEEYSPTLNVGQTPAVFGVHANQRGELRTSGLAGSLTGSRSGKQFEGVFATLNSGGNDGGFRTEPGEHLVCASSGERARALTASMHKRHDEDTDTLIAARVTGVRRLTPYECELLQGFPPGWTCLCGEGHRGSAFCRCSDSPRYRALGNAVTVPVIQWIARRILETEGLTEDRHVCPNG